VEGTWVGRLHPAGAPRRPAAPAAELGDAGDIAICPQVYFYGSDGRHLNVINPTKGPGCPERF
jgi:hypothetical protein